MDRMQLTEKQVTMHPELLTMLSDLLNQKVGCMHQRSTKWKRDGRDGSAAGPEGRNKLCDQVIPITPTLAILPPLLQPILKATWEVLINSWRIKMWAWFAA